MNYELILMPSAQEGMRKHNKSGDKQAVKKLYRLLDEVEEDPTFGTGHPERLKHFEGNVWSREITRKHRLKYEIFEETREVHILQTWGHYDDK